MASATYIGPPPKIMVRIPEGSCPQPSATSRLTMVGAANIEVRRQWLVSANTSEVSKPLDSGTTLIARRLSHQVEPGAVAQRRGIQEAVTGHGSIDLGEVGQRHGSEIAVAEASTLRSARRSARVEKPGEVISRAWNHGHLLRRSDSVSNQREFCRG